MTRTVWRVGEAEVQERWWMWPRSGGERRPALREAPDDGVERVDDRDAQHEQGHRDLGAAEDREQRQGVAHEHHPARADEDRGRVEVPAQEPEERAGEGEAQQGDDRLLAGPVRLITPRVTAAMRAIPDDSPSSPSMKLMLLIIPTIQTTTNSAPQMPSRRITPGPNGLAMAPTVIPSPTGMRATRICPPSCQRARRSKRSSRMPDDDRGRAAEQEGHDVGPGVRWTGARARQSASSSDRAPWRR